MARILSIDYGKKRTGLAVTDPLQIIANGLATVSTSTLFDWLKDYTGREEVERIVIGEPRQTNGQPSENLARVQQFVNRWRKAVPQIPIEYFDERFTSVLAHQAMLDGGLKKKDRQNKALVDEMVRVYGERDPHITVVAGSTGGKAIDRREGIVKGALGQAESYIFTTDDPNFEDPQAICEQMASYVTDDARTQIIVDRDQAITTAIGEAREHADRFNIVLVIGKGHERRNIINGKAVPWPGDATIVRRELDARPAGL